MSGIVKVDFVVLCGMASWASVFQDEEWRGKLPRTKRRGLRGLSDQLTLRTPRTVANPEEHSLDGCHCSIVCTQSLCLTCRMRRMLSPSKTTSILSLAARTGCIAESDAPLSSRPSRCTEQRKGYRRENAEWLTLFFVSSVLLAICDEYQAEVLEFAKGSPPSANNLVCQFQTTKLVELQNGLMNDNVVVCAAFKFGRRVLAFRRFNWTS